VADSLAVDLIERSLIKDKIIGTVTFTVQDAAKILLDQGLVELAGTQSCSRIFA
jgi:hypothetical protein